MRKKANQSVILLVIIMVMGVAGCERPPEKGGTLTQPPVVKVGYPAPDFTLQDTDGRTWKLSDLRGQVVFVNFWATWCPPCREEMPSMQELYKAMPQERFKMLAVLINDDPALAIAFTGKIGTSFPILIDPSSEAGQAYGLTGVPETYIVDKQGILRQKYLGPRDWNSAEARGMILSYMNR